MDGHDLSSAYHRVLLAGYRIATATGELCRPVHLLAALAEGDGPIPTALQPPSGVPLFSRPVDPIATSRLGGAGYLAAQTQQAAQDFASGRGETPAPAHLFLAVLDQAEPEAIALLTAAGLDADTLRRAALAVLEALDDLPPIAMPRLIPAGTLDRSPLPASQLDPTAWAALSWRQDHLPLRRLHRRSHYEALRHLESSACLNIASLRGLDEDQHFSLSRHHLDLVEQLVAGVRPDLVGRHPAQLGVPIATGGIPRHRWRRHTWLQFTVGWGAWISNRQVGLRDRWFQVVTAHDYRGAPQL